MSVRHALLGLLNMAPASGYDLARTMDGELGRYAWQAGHTRIYPELAKLADEGLITAGEKGPRGRRIYCTTPAGDQELHRWVLNPPEQGVVRNEQILRMFLLPAIGAADAHPILEDMATRAQEEARRLRELMDKLDAQQPEDAALPFGRIAGEYGARHHEAMHGWARWALQQLDRGVESDDARDASGDSEPAAG